MGGRIHGEATGKTVSRVYYDSRKIIPGENGLFIALPGNGQHGANYLFDAYEKGIRQFVIPEEINIPELKEAAFVVVRNPLISLQNFAAKHRSRFSYPVVAITGSIGKTVFKEWAWSLLSTKLKVVKSPKSFNSQLGVALSLLEMHENADVALIEVGISEPGEMERLEKIVNPTIGIFTAFGTAHRINFTSEEEHLGEKLKLFRHCVVTFISNSIRLSASQLASVNGLQPESIHSSRFSAGFDAMLGLLKELAVDFDFKESEITDAIAHLPQIALRLETFAGKNDNLIINDTYNLDLDALREALTFQNQLAGSRKKLAIIGGADASMQQEINELISGYPDTSIRFLDSAENINWDEIANTVVLIKGRRNTHLERQISRGKAQTHSTVVEINLSAIRHNLASIKKCLQPGTKILAMVKASGYGSGAERVASYLEQIGVNYFGVAFIDEGIALRKARISKPIVVMNPEGESLDRLTEYELEPAVYSFGQLDAVITQLLYEGKTNYPVHVKFDTGMNRLGFEPEDVSRILSIAQSQPEIRIAGIYSHLADADNYESDAFTQQQISLFGHIRSEVVKTYPGILSHIANSEAAMRFPEAAFDMVRLGIALYGYTTDDSTLQPTISWRSRISQVKTVFSGESVGYGRRFIAGPDMQIAIIPVGYADGFSRRLSNGKGAVVINAKRCAVVGRVCMDMIMVDVTGLNVSEGAEVEIIGENQRMKEFAAANGTIPYEVMTGMSARMHRIYIEE